MTAPTFLADEDFRQDIVQAVLRMDPDIDITDVRQVGMRGADDEQVLAFAAIHSRVVVSHDANTMIADAVARIVGGNELAGLLIVPQGSIRQAIAEDLVLIAGATEAEEWRDRIEFLPL
jgi:hypothetical protein